jgi:hypothetical protein
MTMMYFFTFILMLQQMVYAVGMRYVSVPGKYQVLPIDPNGMCIFNYLMAESTYIDLSGIDHRYPYIENDTSVMVNFAMLLKKKKILEQLQNENDSMINKELLLEDYNKNYTDINYGINMFAGGLIDDWEARME